MVDGQGPPPVEPTPPRSGPITCRVLVVSRNPIVRAGTAVLLGEHADVAVTHHLGEPGDAPPHDVVLHDQTGAVLEPDELERWLSAGVPVVTMVRSLRRHPDHEGGPVAQVSLATEGPHLAATLAAASRGTLLPPADGTDRPAPPADTRVGGIDLSARELDILALIASGWSNQEIAEGLYLSINTVKTYIRHAYRKLGVSRRSQAVLWCLAHDVTSTQPPPGQG